jgi:hypothetical protein
VRATCNLWMVTGASSRRVMDVIELGMLFSHDRCWIKDSRVDGVSEYKRCLWVRGVTMSEVSLSQICHWVKSACETDVSGSKGCLQVRDVWESGCLWVKSIAIRLINDETMFLPLLPPHKAVSYCTQRGSVSVHLPLEQRRVDEAGQAFGHDQSIKWSYGWGAGSYFCARSSIGK